MCGFCSWWSVVFANSLPISSFVSGGYPSVFLWLLYMFWVSGVIVRVQYWHIVKTP